MVCCKPVGHEGNHLATFSMGTPIAWREGRTIEGDVGPAIDAELRSAFEHIKKGGGDE